jgi:heptosyltransferase-2
VTLSERLLAAGIRVVVTGGPSDTWVKPSFKRLGVADIVAETSLMELTAFYASCDVVVTHDTGPLHLASLSGVPVVALFGPTNPAEKVSADGPTHVMWGGETLACRPCYDGKEYAACSSNACMQAISVEAVYGKIIHLLKHSAKPK